jgi:hypothetical protein
MEEQLVRVLVLPDGHVFQDQDVSRYKAAGNYAADKRPDVICSMGDFMAMKSICHWDNNKRLTMEGKRYKAEVDSGNLALNLLMKPIKELQEKQREQKIKIYKPSLEFLEGNHEFWVHKYLEQYPSMEGHIDIDKDLNLTKRGWNITPYREYLEINGVLFTHIPMSGDPNQAIRGNPICQTASRYVGKSCVFAHTHRWEQMTFTKVGTPDITILTCGAFFEEEPDEFGSNIWRGLTILNIYEYGMFDVEEQISLKRLMKEYM